MLADLPVSRTCYKGSMKTAGISCLVSSRGRLKAEGFLTCDSCACLFAETGTAWN